MRGWGGALRSLLAPPALALCAACVGDRERPRPVLQGPQVPPSPAILEPSRGAVVPTPASLPVVLEVTNTSDLLEFVRVRAVRLANREIVAEAESTFAQGVGDQVWVFTLELGRFPDNTQLDLIATAGAFGGAIASDTVPVIALDCAETRWPICP